MRNRWEHKIQPAQIDAYRNLPREGCELRAKLLRVQGQLAGPKYSAPH